LADTAAPSVKRRVETQLLHFQDDAWRPYSYIWDDDQADAVLADAAGAAKTLSLSVPGQRDRRTRDYRVHARAECLLCHNPWVERKSLTYGVQSASPLGVNTPQMNRTCQDAGRSVNQLTYLHEIGLLSWTPEPKRSPKLADAYDDSADVNL